MTAQRLNLTMDNDKKLTKLPPLTRQQRFFGTNQDALAPPNSTDILKAPKQRQRKAYDASAGVPSKIDLIYALRKSSEEANHPEGSVDASEANKTLITRPSSVQSRRNSHSRASYLFETASPTLNEVIKKLENIAKEQAASIEEVKTIFAFANLK